MKKILYIILLFLLVSCTTTKTIYTPVETIKTEYINSVDSVFLHDSIYYEVKTKNDTIFETKYKYRVLEKYNTDTIIKVDSIPVVQEVEKIVETNTLYLWQKILMYTGLLALISLVIWLILKIKK